MCAALFVCVVLLIIFFSRFNHTNAHSVFVVMKRKAIRIVMWVVRFITCICVVFKLFSARGLTVLGNFGVMFTKGIRN